MAIPLLDVVAEDADLIVRYGTGHYADVEYMEIARDVYTPLASPAFLRQHGPIDAPEALSDLPLLRSPLEPWQPWFRAAVWTGPNRPKARSSTMSACCAMPPRAAWALRQCA